MSKLCQLVVDEPVTLPKQNDPRYKMLLAMAECELKRQHMEHAPEMIAALATKAWQARGAAIEQGLGITAVLHSMYSALQGGDHAP